MCIMLCFFEPFLTVVPQIVKVQPPTIYLSINAKCTQRVCCSLGQLCHLDTSDGEASLSYQLQQLQVVGSGVMRGRGEVGWREEDTRGLCEG